MMLLYARLAQYALVLFHVARTPETPWGTQGSWVQQNTGDTNPFALTQVHIFRMMRTI